MTGSILEAAPAPAPTVAAGVATPKSGATFLVCSGELDKLLVAFTMATAAAASGMATTMFFTFWSLAALRQPVRVRGKNLIERMFGWMLPRGTAALPLSKMNFGGCGPRLIRWLMRRKNVASLEEQMATAKALGVRFLVCETSMELMGFRREEMPSGVEYAGAATCVATAARSEISLVV